MSHVVKAQIDAYVNSDDVEIECLIEHCAGQLEFVEYHMPSGSQILRCEGCNTKHYIDQEGLSHG